MLISSIQNDHSWFTHHSNVFSLSPTMWLLIIPDQVLDPGSGLIIFLFQRLTTTRNVLLANMALSNLALCAFTMPLTLLDLLHHYWPLASGQEVLCKLTSHTQSTFVFFSSWSVMLIAVDRLVQYRVTIKERYKERLHCDPIKSPGEFLSLLEAHQIWSIW